MRKRGAFSNILNLQKQNINPNRNSHSKYYQTEGTPLKMNESIRKTHQKNDTKLKRNQNNKSIANFHTISSNCKSTTNHQTKKQKQKHDQKIDQLKTQNQHLKGINKRLEQKLDESIIQYETYIRELQTQKKNAQKLCNQYSDSIKFCLMWIIQAYGKLAKCHQKITIKEAFDYLQKYLVKAFSSLKEYLDQMGIENSLKNLDSANELNLKLITDQSSLELSEKKQCSLNFSSLNSLQDTFNLNAQNNYNVVIQNPSKQVLSSQILSKKLFQLSLQDNSLIKQTSYLQLKDPAQKNQQENTTRTVQAVTNCDVQCQNQNYIALKKGDKICLLRKVNDLLWIGQIGDRIGYIQQKNFDFIE